MKECNPFLSVIIPVYKVERYLEQCVDSVLNQDLSDYEIILVDDGSPDQCPQMCDDYKKRYSEISVIHQDNKGLSGARNTGIHIARGSYIMFLDSDDWWNPLVKVDRILQIVKSNSDVEMFLLNGIDYLEGKGYFKRTEHQHFAEIRTDSVEHYYQDLISSGNLEVAAYTKILQRDFIINNQLYFSNGLLGEDNEWMIRVLRNLKRVQIIDEPLYVYRGARKDSISNTINKKNIVDLLIIVENSVSYWNHSKNVGTIKDCELCFCAYLWFSALGLSSKLARTDRLSLLPGFKRTADICRYSNSSKTRIAYWAYKLTGIRITTFILGLYIRLKPYAIFKKDSC